MALALAYHTNMLYHETVNKESRLTRYTVNRMPEEILEAMKRIAREEGRSMNQEMIQAFKEHTKRHQAKKASEQD